MKNKTYTLNTLLAAVLGTALLAAVVLRALAPHVILPRLDIPNLVLISLTALVLDHTLAPDAPRCYICIPVFSAITFGLLPLAAMFVTAVEALKLAVLGCVVFTAVTWVFSSMLDRLSSGPAAKLAPLVSALCVYLAAQCFAGIL